MSNLILNRLSVVIPDSDFSAIKDKIKSISLTMPFLTGLTPRERETLPKIDVNNKAFVEDAIHALKTENIPLPMGASLEEMEKDLMLYEKLDEIALSLQDLLTKVRHTQMLAGSEAFTSALFIYRLVETYHLAGIPGYTALYNQLRKRFMGQSSNATNDSADSKVANPPKI